MSFRLAILLSKGTGLYVHQVDFVAAAVRCVKDDVGEDHALL
jgi:hypothetical protein